MPEAVLPFQKVQYEFTGYIRDPEHNALPIDVEKRRIDMYRELIFNNVEDVLSNCFPVLKKITADKRWRAIASDFLAKHKSHSPYFIDIPKEFLEYLQVERTAKPDDLLFLLELAHYEWIEMDVAYSTGEAPDIGQSAIQNPLSKCFALSDVARILAYQFPVHKICPEYLPQSIPDHPTYLIVYRDADDEVLFLEINVITYRLLQLIQNREENTAKELLSDIVTELKHPNPQVVFSGGTEILSDLIDRNILEIA